jgi:hypothetical protein
VEEDEPQDLQYHANHVLSPMLRRVKFEKSATAAQNIKHVPHYSPAIAETELPSTVHRGNKIQTSIFFFFPHPIIHASVTHRNVIQNTYEQQPFRIFLLDSLDHYMIHEYEHFIK